MIEPKKGWNLHHPPYPPQWPGKPPTERQKVWRRTLIYTSKDSSCYISDIPLPDDCGYSDLYIECNSEYLEPTLSFYVVKLIEEDNPNFMKELKEWQLKYDEWKILDKEYHEELTQWSRWKNDHEKKTLHDELNRAEILLRKHGRINDD